MKDLELPQGKRTRQYRFFEIFPAMLSYGAILLLIVLSIFNPVIAALYLMAVIITLLVKAALIAYHTILGHRRLVGAQRIDWHERLTALENPEESYAQLHGNHSSGFGYTEHLENLRKIAAKPGLYPKPSDLYHGIIIATYNESYEVIQPTVESVIASSCDKKHIILTIAYEERGGKGIEETVKRLQRKYQDVFFDFQVVKHPDNLPGEVIGKGGNITFAGYELQKLCDRKKIDYANVVVTTLDCDNKPYPSYFDYVAYEYITRTNRKHLSYQPIALYFGNIWDAPAAMRVIATGNSFWTIISSMRPHTLRNFAAHSQPLDALVEMNFWTTRSIVEDGHQYWRSYFHFDGDYGVIPIHVPIYQDAVMADTLRKTFVTQFKQLRRWGYGVSDIPFVAVRIFTKKRTVPFFEGLARFIRLVDGHVTLACVAVLVTFGGWVPLLLNAEASRSIFAHQLPGVVSTIQRIAMIGLFVTILLMLRMLPPRPERYKRTRTLGMVLQWLLMPVTAIGFNSVAAYNAQTHLALGKYLDKFDVTEKATLASKAKARELASKHKKAQ